MTSVEQPKPGGKRVREQQRRRQAILDAAFELFTDQGFAATRLDEVAARAGVAKGTIYLFFKDKEDLFETAALAAIGPMLQNLDSLASRSDLPFEMLLTQLAAMFQREILMTKRREIVRLVIAEGARFPRIAEFYHREVISRGLALIRQAAARAHERGELSTDALVRFPQLLFAPVLLSIVWESTFSAFEPLDIAALLAAHRELLLSPSASAKP